MPTLNLRFPGGRYHATPWGHHVNEGLIEWPPSPWRLLRALVACGFSSQHWNDVPVQAQQLINKLAGVLPSFRLPEASAAHSRHFMPVGTLQKGRERTTLVFDTWAHVGDDELFVHWPCRLNDDEETLLKQLANSLGYLGRSESWVEATIVADPVPDTLNYNAVPCQAGEHRGYDWEQVSLMAAIPPVDYASWRQQQADTALAAHPLPEGKKKPPKNLLNMREKSIDPFPPDLLACLTKDTSWWKQYGWSQPPGSQRVLYWRRSDSLQVGAPQRPRRRKLRPIKAMLLSLTTPSGNRSALPPCTRTLPQAELFHRALVRRVGNGQKVNCPELTGKDEHDRPLQAHHRHAHTIPLDLDGDGHLDHLLIYAPMGLGEAAQRAVRSLDRTWTKGGVGDIQLAVAGSGELDTLRSLPPPLNQCIRQLLGPNQGARVWVSKTPFVPPRFLKKKGVNSLLGQVNAELDSRQFAPVQKLDSLPKESIELRHYIRRRRHGGMPPPIDVGYALRLKFAEPVQGPITLGYASHFGLGLFATSPIDD